MVYAWSDFMISVQMHSHDRFNFFITIKHLILYYVFFSHKIMLSISYQINCHMCINNIEIEKSDTQKKNNQETVGAHRPSNIRNKLIRLTNLGLTCCLCCEPVKCVKGCIRRTHERTFQKKKYSRQNEREET